VSAVDIVLSERLELIGLNRSALEALVAGRDAEVTEVLRVRLPDDWMAEHAPLARMRLEQILEHPDSEPWLLRAMVTAEPRAFVGHFNFHGPPGPEGWVELGYSIIPEQQRRGYAQEAAVRMMRWARDEHGIVTFRASISPANQPSLAMIHKLGFERIGMQWDEEDGEEIVFERSGIPELAG
jgi:ribosomal-protein-alanine N-acetyltransferase